MMLGVSSLWEDGKGQGPYSKCFHHNRGDAKAQMHLKGVVDVVPRGSLHRKHEHLAVAATSSGWALRVDV